MRHFQTCVLLLFIIIKNIACPNDKPIIIVGGGAAGIGAGYKLLENGFQNVLILEAENRLGGRINSVYYKEAFVDLGAENCGGETENVVFDLVKNYNLLIPQEIQFHIYHSHYKQLNEDISNKLIKLYDELYSEEIQSNLTLGHHILNKYNSTALKYFHSHDDLKLALDAIDLIEKLIITDIGTFSWFDTSAEVEYKNNQGNQTLSWNGRGYKTILDILLKQQPNLESKILLNKEVTQVDWTNDNSVTVKCSDNTVYKADHVIVTVSLGVLKHTHETLFNPALPNYKIRAIKDLGFAAITKIYIYFPNIWWPSGFNDFTFLWTKDDIERSYQEFSEGPHKGEVSWITTIIGVFKIQKNPNVLLVWIAGEFVPQVELCNDSLVINGIMHTLDKFVGYEYKNITRPSELLRFNWYNHPHFHGSYSFETIKSRQNRVSQDSTMSQPLMIRNKPSLLFAGEATNSYRYATVHGAMKTGFREANRLIEFYNKVR